MDIAGPDVLAGFDAVEAQPVMEATSAPVMSREVVEKIFMIALVNIE
ncbi:hypothetical protein [Noviherbaspirillum sp.]